MTGKSSLLVTSIISAIFSTGAYWAATRSPTNLAGPSKILTLPQGNAYPTFATLNVQADATLPYGTKQTYEVAGTRRLSGREYMASFGMTNATGGYAAALGSPASLDDPTDKVALYAGIDCRKGGAPCWTINSSLVIEAGFAPLGHGATGYELDVNNNDVDSGGGDGPGGMVEPGYYGLTLAGAGRHPVTAAVSIGGPGSHPTFHRGLVDTLNAVDQCLVCEYGNAFRVVDARGTGQNVLDSSKGHYGAPINIGYGQAMTASKPDGSGGLQWLQIGGDGSVNFVPLGATLAKFGTPIATPLSTPASSSAPCKAGQFSDDANYHYVCVAQNKWKRVALSAF